MAGLEEYAHTNHDSQGTVTFRRRMIYASIVLNFVLQNIN